MGLVIVIDQGNFDIKDKLIKFANTWECLILTNSVFFAKIATELPKIVWFQNDQHPQNRKTEGYPGICVWGPKESYGYKKLLLKVAQL